jgi:uncharacterized protein (DUF983 family)
MGVAAPGPGRASFPTPHRVPSRRLRAAGVRPAALLAAPTGAPPQPTVVPDATPEFTWSRLGTLVGRALRLRCPNCGGHPVRASWLKRLPGCPSCGLRLDRGENDYFIGAYLLNLIVAELIIGFGLLTVLIATWPDPPWDLIQYGGVVLVIIAPLVTYPFSELTWLAVDLALRPLTPAELEWHREGSLDGRELPHR